MIPLLLLGAAYADCPPNALAVVMQRVGEVKAAYDAVDIVAFDKAATSMDETIPCIAEPISRDLVIQIHYAEGLRLFANQDGPAAQRALAAVRILAPEWRPNASWMQDTQPMYQLYMTVIPPEQIPLAARPPGGWLVDGVPSGEIPGDRAFVLQAIGKKDDIVYTGYHTSPTTLPEFDFPTGERRKTVHLWGTATAGVVAVAAGTTAGLALAARHTVVAGADTTEETLAASERANTLGVVAAGLGVGTVGAVAVTWAISW